MGHVLVRVMPQAVESMEASTNIKMQAHGTHKIFQLVQPPTSVSTNGKGDLVDEAAKAFKTKNIDHFRDVIREKLDGFLYNNGNGKHVPHKDMIERRNFVRQSKNSSLGQGFLYKGEGSRFCCWDVDKRGPLGETALHVCFLNNSQLHNFLAKEMINVYPNLLLDIYQGDEYYGENCIHMAIANQDMEMLQFILKKQDVLPEVEPSIIQERCCGSFFSTADQKNVRSDREDSEIVDVSVKTNYQGLLYWGEYPLSFAACADEIGAFRLLLENGADLAAEDINGNNVLHLMVIHNNKEMFQLAYRHKKVVDGNIVHVGREILEKRNRQRLTPLTLAAKLANKEMLDYILELKREVEWEFGSVTCAKYPLADVDTIDPDSGDINTDSALSIILNHKSRAHLEMLDGMLFQLLHEKWKQYGKLKFYLNGFAFFVFLVAFIAAIIMQPAPVYVTNNSTNVTSLADSCYLLKATDSEQIARFALEIFVYVMAIAYIIVLVYDIYKEGIFPFLSMMYTAPMNSSFYISLIFILSLLPCRLTCSVEAETVFLTLALCTCIPHCLFYCRGFKIVGPFIIAIYNMITGDLLRFLVIYSIFVAGFSQAMFVIFRGVHHELFSHPGLSIVGMFIITLGEFGDLYADFDTANNSEAAKTLFVLYMVLGTILLINVLIAMFGHTFNVIAETRWEWQRQWARIVLIMERSVPKEKRKIKQSRYSQPGRDLNERWFVVRNFKCAPKK